MPGVFPTTVEDNLLMMKHSLIQAFLQFMSGDGRGIPTVVFFLLMFLFSQPDSHP